MSSSESSSVGAKQFKHHAVLSPKMIVANKISDTMLRTNGNVLYNLIRICGARNNDNISAQSPTQHHCYCADV